MTGNNQDYDEFKNWYTNEAPDESELNMVDMAYLAWTQGKAALSQQDAVGVVVEANDGTLVAIASVKAGTFKTGDKVYTAPPSTAQEGTKEILQTILKCLTEANESALLADVIWLSDGETLFDYIENSIERVSSQPTAQGVVTFDDQKLFDFFSNEHGLTLLSSQMSDIVNAVRDAIAAQGVEPVAWMFQHEETGITSIVDTQQIEWGFEKNNPRLQKICPLYASPPLEDGMVRVPVEPTDEMIDAACDAPNLYRVDFIRSWDAAIEASKGE